MEPLIAESLQADPRFIEAKKHLLNIVQEYQSQLTGIRPPRAERRVSYEELLKQYESQRGFPLWYPYIGSGIGRGALVELMDGSVKYDLISGIGVHWGHGNPSILEAAINASTSDLIMQGNLQLNQDAAELSSLILKQTELAHLFLTTSGSMACENALKIIFQKKFPASRLLAFEHCFMGRTTTLCQVTDKPAFREGIPLCQHVDYLPFFDPVHPTESTARAVETLKGYLKRYPHQYAAICCEMIQGEGGVNVGNGNFFSTLFDLLKEHDVAIFIDEVQTFGRTPRLFAYQYFDLDAYVDVVTFGKISQVCGTLFSKEFKPRPGLLSQTFIGSTSAIQASLQIVKSLLHDNYLGPEGKLALLHRQFAGKLDLIAQKTGGLIKGPYGIGSMVAFTPFNGVKERVYKLTKALFEEGVIVFYSGENPTRIRCLLPAGGISLEDIDPICAMIEQTLRKMG